MVRSERQVVHDCLDLELASATQAIDGMNSTVFSGKKILYTDDAVARFQVTHSLGGGLAVDGAYTRPRFWDDEPVEIL